MYDWEPAEAMPRDELVQLLDRASMPVVVDGKQVRRRLHDMRRRLALVAEVTRRKPGVLAHGDPYGVDAVLAEGVCDPLRDHDRDHERQDVRERASELRRKQSGDR